MHIPDAAISPVTSLAAGAAMLPVWAVAGRKLRTSLGVRQTPLLAIGAAFCFTIMMFNIPAPGGTTVHPTGGVLLAVLLGPAAAIVGMTVALAVQALFFGDGGVLAIGVNAFTMAFAAPVCGYLAYRLLAAKATERSPRKVFAAGVGAYAGLNAAALLTAVILGIQPALFHASDGRALFFPFGLRVTIPALMAAHLFVAGIAEAGVTMAAVRYLRVAGIPLYGECGDGVSAGPRPSRRGRIEILWVGLAAIAALSPLGLLARGDAWGEWGTKDFHERAGYVPAGMGRIDTHGWKGFNLLPDYLGGHGMPAYVAAAMAGIALILVATYLVVRGLRARKGTEGGDVEAANDLPLSDQPAVPSGQVPAWLLVGEVETVVNAPSRPSRLSHGSGFVERTLAGIADGVRESLVSERLARNEGLLQRVEPRVKVATLLGFVVITALAHKPWVLSLLYVAALVLGIASGLPVSMMLRRVWLAVPLFVGVVTLPPALNLVTPGRPLLVLCQHPLVTLTEPGIITAMLLTARVGVALTFGLLLTVTTPWTEMLRGLSVLWIPRVFLAVVAMTYRYLAVLMTAASDLFTARKSRTVGRASHGDNRRFLGGAMGALFGKTVALTEEVHAAMLSRGWTGEPRSLDSRKPHRDDLLWLAGMAVLAVCILGGEFLA